MKKKPSKTEKPRPLTKHSVSGSISTKHYYSGNASKKFWEAVNSIKNKANRQEVYSLGVALQNLEEYVLRQMHNSRKYCR